MFVSDFSVWVTAAYKQYTAVKTLIKRSVNDPPNNPYCSKYSAREILLGLISEIEINWKGVGIPQVRWLDALFNYELGQIAVETEEIATGSELLTNTITKIRDISETRECCYLSISLLNALGTLWCNRGDFQQSLDFLSQAQDLYKKYKSGNNPVPLIFNDFFMYENAMSSEENYIEFEKTHTLTLYYLAQVHEHLNNHLESAEYFCHTLRRQKESGDYETNDWVTNCATLSQLFIERPDIKDFSRVRHLLFSALFTLTEYEKENKEDEQALDTVMRSKASLACCLLKFCCISLISESANQPAEEQALTANFPKLMNIKDLEKLDEELPSCVDSFEKASIVFRFAQKQAAIAKEYYTLDSFASTHANIIQNQSKLYEALILYEQDISRKCKMHKRRLDLLDDVLKKLNPQYFLGICRQLQFELGEIPFEMYSLKRTASESGKSSSVSKLNGLVIKSISYYNAFIDSFKNKEGVLPELYSDDEARSVLVAHFNVGSLQSKIVEIEKEKKINNFNTMEKYFQYIVDYVEKNPDHEQYIRDELSAVKDMLKLMPEKLQMIALNRQ